jgi:hypothetical protein
MRVSERTTPPPQYTVGSGPADLPDRMLHDERSTLRTAAVRVRKLYPGPLGELAARELMAVDEFGWRLVNDSLIGRLRDQIDREWRAASLTT